MAARRVVKSTEEVRKEKLMLPWDAPPPSFVSEVRPVLEDPKNAHLKSQLKTKWEQKLYMIMEHYYYLPLHKTFQGQKMNFRGEMKYGAEVALSVYDQFQESAKLYGKMIILGRFRRGEQKGSYPDSEIIRPVKVENGQEFYIINNILFRTAVDDFGGNEYLASKAAGLEYHAMSGIVDMGLLPLSLFCLIDYLGFRLVASVQTSKFPVPKDLLKSRFTEKFGKFDGNIDDFMEKHSDSGMGFHWFNFRHKLVPDKNFPGEHRCFRDFQDKITVKNWEKKIHEAYGSRDILRHPFFSVRGAPLSLQEYHLVLKYEKASLLSEIEEVKGVNTLKTWDLVYAMRNKNVNLRYLGGLISYLKKDLKETKIIPFVTAIIEVTARAIKIYLRHLMSLSLKEGKDEEQIISILVQELNSFFYKERKKEDKRWEIILFYLSSLFGCKEEDLETCLDVFCFRNKKVSGGSVGKLFQLLWTQDIPPFYLGLEKVLSLLSLTMSETGLANFKNYCCSLDKTKRKFYVRDILLMDVRVKMLPVASIIQGDYYFSEALKVSEGVEGPLDNHFAIRNYIESLVYYQEAERQYPHGDQKYYQILAFFQIIELLFSLVQKSDKKILIANWKIFLKETESWARKEVERFQESHNLLSIYRETNARTLFSSISVAFCSKAHKKDLSDSVLNETERSLLRIIDISGQTGKIYEKLQTVAQKRVQILPPPERGEQKDNNITYNKYRFIYELKSDLIETRDVQQIERRVATEKINETLKKLKKAALAVAKGGLSEEEFSTKMRELDELSLASTEKSMSTFEKIKKRMD